MFNVCIYVYLLYLYDIYTEERLFLNILAAATMYLSTLFFSRRTFYNLSAALDGLNIQTL